MTAINGLLAEASVPDVLQLLAMGRKTGCLALAHKKNFGYIYIDAGRISYASIVNRPDRIGERLVQAGAITAKALAAAIEEQSTHGDRRVGDLLVERGLITRDTLHEYLRVQVEQTVYRLYTWREGTFQFDTGVRPPHEENLVAIDPQSLMLEGARRVDEWALIEKSIPTLDIVFELDRGALAAAAAPLADEQRRVLDHVDGKRDVTAVIEASGLSEFDVGRALHDLREAGVVRELHRTSKPAPAVDGERADEHYNLGVAFYRAAMFAEAERELRRVLELESNVQARAYLGLILMRQEKWEAAVGEYETLAAVTPTTATFHNLGLALERLGRYAEARTALRNAAALCEGADARVQTSIGAVSLLMGDAAAADQALTTAKALWAPHPSAWWYHYAALAAVWVGDVDRARALLEEGIARHSGTAVLHNNLAALHERRGAYEPALAQAKLGLAEDENMPQLHKNVGDLCYRAGRHDEAHDAYQRSVALDPARGSDVYLKLGNILLKRQQRSEASDCWRRALELDPDNGIARNNLDALARLTA